MKPHAEGIATNPWRWRLPLHQVQLLSSSAISWFSTTPGSISENPGRSAAEIQFRRSRFCRDAGALSYPDERTKNRQPFPADAGAETTCGEELPRTKQIDEPAASLRGGICSSVLADAVLRLQCLQRQEEDGEAALHASQPGEARAGGVSGGVAMEQLSLLPVG
jgi:hypothetical protein